MRSHKKIESKQGRGRETSCHGQLNTFIDLVFLIRPRSTVLPCTGEVAVVKRNMDDTADASVALPIDLEGR